MSDGDREQYMTDEKQNTLMLKQTQEKTGRVSVGTVISIQMVIIAGILIIHYQHMIDGLIYKWRHDGDWSHGFLIPLFGIYYLYLHRERVPKNINENVYISRIAGAILMTTAFLLYVYSTLAQVEYPKNLSLIVTIMGIVLMTAGWPISRWSWFAVAFLIFAMPLPQRLYQQLTMPLREVAANISGVVLSLVPGMMAEPQGTVVEYIYKGDTGTLDIERACSGMRLLMTMTALGVAMAFMHQRPLWQRMVMILACVPIAILCNIIRVTTTGFFVVFGKHELARGFWHMMLGLGMLFVAFSLYSAISYVLGNLFVEHEVKPAEELTNKGERN
jgi:exosortase